MRVSTKKALVAWIATTAAATALAASSIGQVQASPLTSKDQLEPSHAAADPAFATKERAAGRDAVSTPASRSALTTVQSSIAEYVAKNGTRYTFGTYSDPATGGVVVETDAPAGLVASLTRLPSNTGIKVTTRRSTISDYWNRGDDIPPYYGGGALQSTSGGSCSAGYAVKKPAGTKFMVTAGHCYPNGATVKTGTGLHTVGVVSNRLLSPVDAELIGGQTYAGRIFTGGVLSNTSAPVVGAGAASVGFTHYCHSGRSTGEQCEHRALSTTAQLCSVTGCKAPLILFDRSVMPQPGDSGAPFYAKDGAGSVWIRGHVIGGTPTTGYAEPWATVAGNYGVSIVTG